MEGEHDGHTDDSSNNPDTGADVYDIQLTKSTGEVDTFITKAKFKLTEAYSGQYSSWC